MRKTQKRKAVNNSHARNFVILLSLILQAAITATFNILVAIPPIWALWKIVPLANLPASWHELLTAYRQSLPTILTENPTYLLAFDVATVFLLMFLFVISPLSGYLLRKGHGFVEPRPELKSRLERLLEPVCQAAGKNPAKFRLYVQASGDINAYAFGRRSIAVTSNAGNLLNDFQLKGVLAHEVGHLHYREGMWNILFYWLNLPILALNKVAVGIANFTYALRKTPILMLPFLPLNWMAQMLSWLTVFLLEVPRQLGKLVSSASEYRADVYAADIGFGENLLSYFKLSGEIATTSAIERETF